MFSWEEYELFTPIGPQRLSLPKLTNPDDFVLEVNHFIFGEVVNSGFQPPRPQPEIKNFPNTRNLQNLGKLQGV